MSNANQAGPSKTYPQGKYWLITIPAGDWLPCLPPSVVYVRGQREVGEGTGYEHWQVLACYGRKVRLGAVKATFGVSAHCELSRSAAATLYVWKEETRVEGTQFEFGDLPVQRNSAEHWAHIWEAAKNDRFEDIEPQVKICHYSALNKIRVDYMKPQANEKVVKVFWGPTGVGKSRRAWEEAGLDAYPKNSRTKFWCGYRDQENVVIDEMDGAVDITNLLTWFDRYPVIVETKGSAVVLRARRIWITSNIDPREWFPTKPQVQVDALLRRLDVTYCPYNMYALKFPLLAPYSEDEEIEDDIIDLLSSEMAQLSPEPRNDDYMSNGEEDWDTNETIE